MQKKLNLSDYMYVTTFIFMLVVAVGTFFLGLQMGQQRVEAKYAAQLEKDAVANHTLTAYHQQYLVSFYHTIYQPYREFHKKWFLSMDTLQNDRTADGALILKDLAKTASETQEELKTKSMPDSSPMLKDAQAYYIVGLEQFSDALKGHVGKANSLRGWDLIQALNADPALNAARTQVLKAEKAYYDSIIQWFLTVNPSFTPIDVTRALNLEEWSGLSLNMKNDYVAQLMLSSGNFAPYTPQDLTVRIDEMVASQQAARLNLKDVKSVSDMLLATKAVRLGDFQSSRGTRYDAAMLPQLPFFTN